MADDNCIALMKDLCASFLRDDQRTSISEHDLTKLVKSTLSNIFIKYKSDKRNADDGYALLRTEIISHIVANGVGHKNHSEDIRNYLSAIEEIYQLSDEKDELNSMFLFLYKLSQDPTNNVPQAEDSSASFFGGTFDGSNWNIFHRDPGPICPTFSYPFYEPPGTGLKFTQNYCPSFEPLSNDFSKFYDGKFKLYRFDLNRPVEFTSQDEGFVTPGSEFSNETDASTLSTSSAMSISSSSDEYEFDSQVLRLCKKTWEQLGSEKYYTELPFASEHPDCVIPLWKILNASRSQKEKVFSLDSRVRCTFEELKCDLQYLLFGMNSSSFFYNSMTKTFYIRDKLHMKTLTPEIVADLCEPFLQSAAYYHALKTFVEERRNLPFGPTHQVYCRSLLEILNVYRYTVLNLNWNDIRYAVQLDSIIMPFQKKLQFLTRFCLITIGEETDGSNFPSGVQLLDYLFNNLMKVFRTDFSCLLIHLFEKCCNMYLKIVSEWIFEGCFSSLTNYTEFFIEIQQEDELCRDWRRVSCIKLKEKRVPKFLEKFYKDVFICGKSVNLLKIFTRRDVLDTLLAKDYPAIKCCFNKSQLDAYVGDWKKFQFANDRRYDLQKKVKETLFKTYGPEFYANVKRVPDAWFANYEEGLKPKIVIPVEEKAFEKSNEVTGETSDESEISSNKTNIKIPNVNSDDISTDESGMEKTEESNEPVEKKEVEAFEDETSDKTKEIDVKDENLLKYRAEILTEVEEEKPKLKTKKLVEFYEQLNSSSTTPEKSPRNSPKRTARSPKPINFERNPENGADASTSPRAETPKANAAPNPLLESRSPTPFSDYKGGAESGRRMKTSTPAVQNTVPAKFCNSGGGDFVSPLAKPAAPRMPGASGDGPLPAMPFTEADTKSAVQLSELQRNRLRSVYSDHQNQLNVTDDLCVKRADSTPLTDRQQNRLKSMSSDCMNPLPDSEIKHSCTPLSVRDQNKLRMMSGESMSSDCMNPMPDSEIKPSCTPLSVRDQNKLRMMSGESMSSDCMNPMPDSEIKHSCTPLSVRDQNKLRVMSSEYHQRLSVREPPRASSVGQTPREMSEYEKNRQKVMSSEYHLRLMDCVSHDERVQKLGKAMGRLECQINKRNVLAAEFDLQPKSWPVTPLQSGRVLEKETDQTTSPEQTCPPASLTLETDKSLPSLTNADEDITEEPETMSEDIESEDQITVVENIVQNLPSLPMEPTKNGLSEAPSLETFRPNDGLKLETFVSYGASVFRGIDDADTANCLQSAAQSVYDVDRTSMLYFLSQSIRIPLRVQMKIVNDAILRVFIEEEGYLEHLTTLRNYLLLRKSEFCISLTNTMFKMAEQVKKPYLLLNNYTLSCLLQQALLAGNSRESIRFERKLYFSVDDIIPQSFDFQDIKTLKAISLNYSVKWPINVLITEPIIKKYSRIFKFLMQIQRTSWTLKGDFVRLKILKRGKSAQYTLIQIYRHTMTQVVRILHEFVMREGIERCWNELAEYLDNSEITLDGLYISHLKYTNKIMQRCFLCDQSATCHESVLNLLSSVLQYHAALRSGTWHRNEQVNFLYHTNFKNIEASFKQFQLHLNDIRAKLRLLVYTQQRLYFEPLLVELSR